MRLTIFLAAFLLGVSAYATAEDRFTSGTTWFGTRQVNPKMEQEWRLQITKRDGNKFEGEMTIEYKGSNTYTVNGTAPVDGDGPIRFDSVKSGSFQQSFQGTVREDLAQLTFKGRSMVDTDVEGTATLHRGSRLYKTRSELRKGERTGMTIQEQLAQRNKARAKEQERVKKLVAQIEAEAKKLTKSEIKAALVANQMKTTEDHLRFHLFRERLAVIRQEEMTPEQRKAGQEILSHLLGALVSETTVGSGIAELNEKRREMELRNGPR